LKRKKKVKKRIKNKMGLIIKSNIRPRVKELDKDDEISSVSDEVETALERKVEDILAEGIKRAKANGRRTLQARDL
jgi:histone H3/H4